mmetsp:Transcript_5691/g.13087  ORF Transcript_5691/g.13087 Transcript_5691/m.13087 type:complete len:200 (+) Transcript_5691:105-704(+)
MADPDPAAGDGSAQPDVAESNGVAGAEPDTGTGTDTGADAGAGADADADADPDLGPDGTSADAHANANVVVPDAFAATTPLLPSSSLPIREREPCLLYTAWACCLVSLSFFTAASFAFACLADSFSSTTGFGYASPMMTPHSFCVHFGIFQGSWMNFAGTVPSSGQYFLINAPCLSWSWPCFVTEYTLIALMPVVPACI